MYVFYFADGQEITPLNFSQINEETRNMVKEIHRYEEELDPLEGYASLSWDSISQQLSLKSCTNESALRFFQRALAKIDSLALEAR